MAFENKYTVMTEEQAKTFFIQAGFKVLAVEVLVNQYWPPAYTELREGNPWFMILTEYGWIKIGHRKRVYSLNWEHTALRLEITDDNVTKNDVLVHAWSAPDLLKYLIALKAALANHQAKQSETSIEN